MKGYGEGRSAVAGWPGACDSIPYYSAFGYGLYLLVDVLN
jgi:hypothetical protein